MVWMPLADAAETLLRLLSVSEVEHDWQPLVSLNNVLVAFENSDIYDFQTSGCLLVKPVGGGLLYPIYSPIAADALPKDPGVKELLLPLLGGFEDMSSDCSKSEL